MRNISLVTFDVRGTLLTFKRSVGEIYADAARGFGLSIDPAVININFSKHVSEMNRLHPNFGLHSGLGWEKWWRNVVIGSLGCGGASPSKNCKNIEPLCNYLINRFATKNEWKLIEGSLDLLKNLEHKGIHMGIISNFDPRLHTILEQMIIRQYFSFVVTSYEAGYSKPDENIFKEAEKIYTNMGHKFDRISTIHVGDSLKHDYFGAKNAGWDAVLLSPFPEENVCDIDLSVVKDLTELKEQFLKM